MKKMHLNAGQRSKFKYLSGSFAIRLLVVKNGATAGVTLGRATGIESFVREYKGYAIHLRSREIAVYPYSHRDSAFSASGDSGYVVANANCNIVDMLVD